MAQSRERIQFVAALFGFLAWVAVLAGMAAVSASRPGARNPLPDTATEAPADTDAEPAP